MLMLAIVEVVEKGMTLNVIPNMAANVNGFAVMIKFLLPDYAESIAHLSQTLTLFLF